jgi:hypothetical protein
LMRSDTSITSTVATTSAGMSLRYSDIDHSDLRVRVPEHPLSIDEDDCPDERDADHGHPSPVWREAEGPEDPARYDAPPTPRRRSPKRPEVCA